MLRFSACPRAAATCSACSRSRPAMSAVSACRMRVVGPDTLIAASGAPARSRIGVATQRHAELVLLVVGAVAAAADLAPGPPAAPPASSACAGWRRGSGAPPSSAAMSRGLAPGQQRLAGAGRVRGDRVADLGEQAHAARARDAVDVDDVAAFEHDTGSSSRPSRPGSPPGAGAPRLRSRAEPVLHPLVSSSSL